MADFSQYGGASDEWLAVEQSLPPPAANQSLAELVQSTNTTREEASAREMIEQGKQHQ